MPHNQSHQQYPCRLVTYTSESTNAWVLAQAQALGISVSQYLAKLIEAAQRKEEKAS